MSYLKRFISVFLCSVLFFTTFFIAAPTSQAASDGADIPVIHVCGSGALLVKNNADGTKETIYPLNIEKSFIEEKTKEFLPVFAKAFFTQEWDEFCDVLVNILVPVFKPMALDKNGEASDGSRADWTWNKKTLRDMKNSSGKYNPTAYKFHYDWRLDPMVIADTLNQYIVDILDVTGKEKVALYGRCLGSNIVAAYMQKYGGEYVQEVIHYASSVYGVDSCSKAFTGELYLPADGIDRFMYDYDLGLEKYYTELLQSFVTIFNKTYGLDIACWAVNNVLEDIYLQIFPEILINSYGTFPSYWSMVNPADYDRAMDTVFYGADLEEYSGLIEKIEYYHENVQLKFEEFTAEQIKEGIEYSNIVKYGIQTAPLTKNADVLSDSIVTVSDASFGATTVKVNETLSDKYISTAASKETAKFISPDKQIDSSTCFSPETTWYIKNLEHYTFPDCVSDLVSQIVNNKNYTVFSDEQFPQYMVYDIDTQTISPMTEENMNTTERWNVTFWDAVKKFFNALFEIIKISFAAA